MSCCYTYCNFCYHTQNHVILDYCVKCGSKNVDAEYEPDESVVEKSLLDE